MSWKPIINIFIAGLVALVIGIICDSGMWEFRYLFIINMLVLTMCDIDALRGELK